MLVLSRKPQQQIIIPALGITLTILRVSSGRVQIGIDAPRHIRINRSEARLMSETDESVAGTALRLLPAEPHGDGEFVSEESAAGTALRLLPAYEG